MSTDSGITDICISKEKFPAYLLWSLSSSTNGRFRYLCLDSRQPSAYDDDPNAVALLLFDVYSVKLCTYRVVGLSRFYWAWFVFEVAENTLFLVVRHPPTGRHFTTATRDGRVSLELASVDHDTRRVRIERTLVPDFPRLVYACQSRQTVFIVQWHASAPPTLCALNALTGLQVSSRQLPTDVWLRPVTAAAVTDRVFIACGPTAGPIALKEWRVDGEDFVDVAALPDERFGLPSGGGYQLSALDENTLALLVRDGQRACVWLLELRRRAWRRSHVALADEAVGARPLLGCDGAGVGALVCPRSQHGADDRAFLFSLRVPPLAQLCWLALLRRFPRLAQLDSAQLARLGVPRSFR